MPRPVRFSPGGLLYHVINRGNGRATVFHNEADFLAFERVLSLACERHDMRLLAWCLMSNHFHLVAWPRRDGALPAFMQWLTTCHVRRYHRHYQGSGHVWQGRYKSFPIEQGGHLLTVLRYIERNPVRAGIVTKAQDWRFGSAAIWAKKGSGSRSVPDPFAVRSTEKGTGTHASPGVARSTAKGTGTASRSLSPLLSPHPEETPAQPLSHWLVRGPTPRPQPWLRFVNREEEAEQLAKLREAVNRGTPFGNEAWQKNAARKLGLESTLRPRGRPTKRSEK
ncbi:MAG: transposase [Planctomycetes bacterium]|nr:transposase [Planctomycetota bacterium]